MIYHRTRTNNLKIYQSIQLFNCVWLFVTPWTAACQVSLSITNSRSLLNLMSIESVMPSSYLILCHPLVLWPSIFSSIRVFSNELVLCIRWLKYLSFNISPFSEISVLISFSMDWFDLLNIYMGPQMTPSYQSNPDRGRRGATRLDI